MNKKGQAEDFVPIIFIVTMILLLMGVFYFFGDVTVNALVFKVENGKVVDSALQEKTIDRLNSWSDSYTSGFYNVEIRDDDGVLIKQAHEAGAGFHTYIIKRYVECVEVEIINSNNKESLDIKEICKK